MASTYSDLKIQLMQTGENTGTWGNVTNANLTALEEAIAESVDVSFSSADVTLTLTNSNASQSARYLRLRCTGTTGGARSLILGSGCQIEKLYLVSNGCADTITVKNTTGSGIAVPAGKTMYVYNNATDVVDAVTHLTSLTLASALPVASGGTGSTTAAFSGENITSLNASNISTGTLVAGRGGTGATTLNAEAVIIGNAAGAVKFVAPGNSSNVLTSNGTAWVSQAPTGGGGGGTVVNVGTGSSNVNGITITGGPITTAGTISLGGGINASTISSGALPVTSGGTGATDAASARNNLSVPSTTGGGATGTGWAISITGSAATVTNGVYTTDFTGSNQSLSSNGYQKLPGGIIIQWGSTTLTTLGGNNNGFAQRSGNVSFPTSFTSAVYSITANVYKANMFYGATVALASATTSGFAASANSEYGADENIVITWMAIGR